MNNLKELINNLNIKFELSKEIRKGETANTYLGNYQNEKSILIEGCLEDRNFPNS